MAKVAIKYENIGSKSYIVTIFVLSSTVSDSIILDVRQ